MATEHNLRGWLEILLVGVLFIEAEGFLFIDGIDLNRVSKAPRRSEGSPSRGPEHYIRGWREIRCTQRDQMAASIARRGQNTFSMVWHILDLLGTSAVTGWPLRCSEKKRGLLGSTMGPNRPFAELAHILRSWAVLIASSRSGEANWPP